MGRQLLEPGGVGGHVVRVDQALVDQDLDHPVEQDDVGAGPDGQVEVGHHGRLGHPGVDHDHRRRRVPEHPRRQQRVVVGDVGSHQQDAVGHVEVGVGTGRAVAAERALVAGHRAGHAQGGVPVVVAQAQAQAGQLAQGVELLRHQLPGRQHRHRVGPVLVEEAPEAHHHRPDGRVP